MKQYVYTPQQAGVEAWPQGELRLDFEVTGNSAEAHIYVVPGNLNLFRTKEDLYKLPYFRGREHRHVFMGLGESTTVYDLPCIFLRPNLTQRMLARDESSIAIPWPVDDFADCITPEYRFDVSFHGWVSTKRSGCQTRQRSIESIRMSRLTRDLMSYPDFYGHRSEREKEVRRRLYKESLRHSMIALCPESIPGNIPYRFYEALSAGREPMLIGSGYVLPFVDVIKWEDHILTLSAEDAYRTGDALESYFETQTGFTITEEQESAILTLRELWDKYFNPYIWHRSFTEAVERKYRSMFV